MPEVQRESAHAAHTGQIYASQLQLYGAFGQLMALELHRRITMIPNAESAEYVRKLAENNGIKLPAPRKKKGFFRFVL